MACERYIGWLDDAALGVLPPSCEAELRAHLGACAACRVELERAGRLQTAIRLGIEASLAAELSRDFAARLSRRMAEESSHSRVWLSGWKIAAAGAVGMLALVGVWRAHRGGPSVETAVRTEAPGNRVQRQGPRLAQPPGAGSRAALAVPRVLAQRHPHPVRSTTTRPKEPEVLVPAGQWLTILRFQEAVWSGRVDVSSLRKESGKPVELEELKIPPLELAELDAEWKPLEPVTDR